ncbi:MAG: hypothetical protein QOJ70_2487 [Acidobacteriota bacterium]|jgi:CheY-like chemotaxis protein|nr:hypothetical protein [Acidobacteriota bacterium]
MSTQLLIAESAVIMQKESHLEADRGLRQQVRRFRILVAENRPSTLRTTSEFLTRAGFEIIPVSSPQAAHLVIKFNIETLDAIILDGRLTKDDNDKDRSGYKLAQDTLAQFNGQCPPIVIFSRYDDRRHIELERDGVSFVSKYEGHEHLVERVKELIGGLASDEPRKTSRPSHSALPVFILDDQGGGDAEQLLAELTKNGVQALPCAGLSALREASPYLPSAIFVVDLDASRLSEGVEAIRALRKLVEESGRPFYVVALSGREEARHEASRVGADVFLPKASAEMDALELITRMAQYKMELDRAAAAERLATQGYEMLLGQLREVGESPEQGMTAPIETVRRALNWSFLMPKEQLVLSSLYTQMLAARGRAADAVTIGLCVEGASMLAADRARGADVRGWLERARRHSPDFTLVWLDEEVFDGGPEENDN